MSPPPNLIPAPSGVRIIPKLSNSNDGNDVAAITKYDILPNEMGNLCATLNFPFSTAGGITQG